MSCNKLGTQRFLRNHLTGFKADNWDQVFGVWQSGQYRAPVIKPLPVKHPTIIDEFPLGRVAVIGAGGVAMKDFEYGTSPVVLESICQGKVILVTPDLKKKKDQAT